MCCPLVFEFSVGIGGFVIGLGQISFFFSLLWYQKDNKDMQIARHATDSYEDSRCDFLTSERDWWVLDATDKCATICHGMSKSPLLIASTEIMKMKICYLENMGAERFKRDWDWCYAKGFT